MIAETYDALKARLESHEQLSGRVFDTVIYDTATQTYRTDYYVILNHALPDEITYGRYTAVADYDATGTFVYDIRVVGKTADQVARVMDAVLRLTVGHRLVIDGRKCDPMSVDSSSPVNYEAAVKPPLYTADVGLELINRPG